MKSLLFSLAFGISFSFGNIQNSRSRFSDFLAVFSSFRYYDRSFISGVFDCSAGEVCKFVEFALNSVRAALYVLANDQYGANIVFA